MRHLKSWACQCRSSDLQVFLNALNAMQCSNLEDLTLMVVNRMPVRRRDLSKERLLWKQLELAVVHGCLQMIQMTVFYLHGARTLCWNSYLHGTYGGSWDMDSSLLWERHSKGLNRWLARLRRRNTMSLVVRVRPWREGWAVSADAGDIARIFGPV